MLGSFTFAQVEPESDDIKVQKPTSSGKFGISINWVVGRTSKDCAKFGICKGSTIDIDFGFGDIHIEKAGVLVERDGNKYFQFDLAAPLDPRKFDTNLYVDSDMTLEAKDVSLTIVAGAYKPDFSTNKNGTYYVPVR